VVSAREAFRDAGSFPWYDDDQDALRRMDVRPPKDFRNRRSRWETAPPNWTLPAWLQQLLEWLAWALLAALLGLIIYLMVRALMAYEAGPAAAAAAPGSALGNADAVASLPFSLPRPEVSLLEEARRLYELGRYAEAVVYLYSYQLVKLDEHRLVRLARGKTNRQYLREVRPPVIRQLLEQTMIAFEDVFFGSHALDRERFESCWNALPDFHRQLEPSPG
jgi:hypothetical protein